MRESWKRKNKGYWIIAAVIVLLVILYTIFNSVGVARKESGHILDTSEQTSTQELISDKSVSELSVQTHETVTETKVEPQNNTAIEQTQVEENSDNHFVPQSEEPLPSESIQPETIVPLIKPSLINPHGCGGCGYITKNISCPMVYTCNVSL